MIWNAVSAQDKTKRIIFSKKMDLKAYFSNTTFAFEFFQELKNSFSIKKIHLLQKRIL